MKLKTLYLHNSKYHFYTCLHPYISYIHRATTIIPAVIHRTTAMGLFARASRVNVSIKPREIYAHARYISALSRRVSRLRAFYLDATLSSSAARELLRIFRARKYADLCKVRPCARVRSFMAPRAMEFAARI